MTNRKVVKFRAVRVVKEPTIVKFHTKDGKMVSFEATRAVEKPVQVNNKIQWLCIHHSEVALKNKKQLNAVNLYHKKLWNMKSSLGWYVGYHAFIDTDGLLTQTRTDQETSAAVIGHNKDSLHICLAGNFNLEFPTQAQINKLKSWLGEKMQLYGLEVEDIKCHRGLQKNRTCPGKMIPDDWGITLMSPIKINPFEVKKQEGIMKYWA